MTDGAAPGGAGRVSAAGGSQRGTCKPTSTTTTTTTSRAGRRTTPCLLGGAHCTAVSAHCKPRTLWERAFEFTAQSVTFRVERVQHVFTPRAALWFLARAAARWWVLVVVVGPARAAGGGMQGYRITDRINGSSLTWPRGASQKARRRASRLLTRSWVRCFLVALAAWWWTPHPLVALGLCCHPVWFSADPRRCCINSLK
jgi:hypothetical protein